MPGTLRTVPAQLRTHLASGTYLALSGISGELLTLKTSLNIVRPEKIGPDVNLNRELIRQ